MRSLNIRNCRLIELPKIGDDKRGFLSIGESRKDIPFEIKRIYYIYKIGDLSVVRGQHAHKKLEQAFFCIHGKVTFLVDDGERREEIELKEPNKGLYIGPKLWHNMIGFSKDTVILAVASDYYNEGDYIRDYDKFVDYMHKGEK
ncbi:WxcM-like domain-containing protein [candidate division WOR-3 bacterium]|nr:WxcM-like domain-containing protein [candidate division WOR-3 bacterium]